MKMKILKIWSTFQTELKYHDHYLADEMYNKNIETIFLTSDKVGNDCKGFLSEDGTNSYTYNNAKIYRLKAFEFIGVPFVYDIITMYKIIKRSDIDIIHLFGIGNPIGILTLFICLITNKKTPIVVNDHSHKMIAKKSFLAQIYYKSLVLSYKVLGNKIQKVYVPNRASHDYMIEMYGNKISSKLK